jgi:hypothetical protein
MNGPPALRFTFLTIQPGRVGRGFTLKTSSSSRHSEDWVSARRCCNGSRQLPSKKIVRACSGKCWTGTHRRLSFIAPWERNSWTSGAACASPGRRWRGWPSAAGQTAIARHEDLDPAEENMTRIRVIGGGLAGPEAALTAARLGCAGGSLRDARIVDGTPRLTPAHQTAEFGELVCSNSLKSESPNTAPWLLKQEMRRAGSALLRIADETAVPAGHALAVDRVEFSRLHYRSH